MQNLLDDFFRPEECIPAPLGCISIGSRKNDERRFCSCNKDKCRYSESMPEQRSRIPDAERDVLACLVQMNEATVRELRDALARARPMQASSVLTLLNRLEARGLVTKRKADRGKAFVFRPTKASARAWSRMMKNLFQQAFGGDTLAFMTSFFETRKPTASEIEQLQTLLDELKSAAPKQEDQPDESSQ